MKKNKSKKKENKTKVKSVLGGTTKTVRIDTNVVSTIIEEESKSTTSSIISISPKNSRKTQKVKKIKEKPLFKFKGIVLSRELSDYVRSVRVQLVKQGCFWSYNSIIDKLVQHINWRVFYRKDISYNYPCGIKFKKVVDSRIELTITDDEYFLNDGKKEVERYEFSNSSKRVKYFIRGADNIIRRYKNDLQFWDSYDEWQGCIWDAIDLYYDINSDEFRESQNDLFTVPITTDDNFTRVFVDFYNVDVKGMAKSEIIELMMDVYGD